jgi:hypothetical protein
VIEWQSVESGPESKEIHVLRLVKSVSLRGSNLSQRVI